MSDNPIVSGSQITVNGITFTVRIEDNKLWAQYRILAPGHDVSPVYATFDKEDKTWAFRPNWASGAGGFNLDDARIIAAAWQVAFALSTQPQPAALAADEAR